MTKLTQIIANREMTLTEGQIYRAQRPLAETGMKVFPVTIRNLTLFQDELEFSGLSYNEANELINEFNEDSFAGRCWDNE